MAASQSRLNSMKSSSYSVKSNFTKGPASGVSPSPLVTSQTNASPRQSSTKSRYASNEPGTAFVAPQPAPSIKSNYLQQRNPSLTPTNVPAGSPRPASPSLSAQHHRGEQEVRSDSPRTVASSSSPSHAAPRSPLAVRNPETQQAHSSERLSPSHSAETETKDESPYSEEAAPSLLTTRISDFPRLSLGEELAQEPVFTEQPTAGSNILAQSFESASRNRGMSAGSNYISRLDPGTDRSSIASFSSRFMPYEHGSRPLSQLGPESRDASSSPAVERSARSSRDEYGRFDFSLRPDSDVLGSSTPALHGTSDPRPEEQYVQTSSPHVDYIPEAHSPDVSRNQIAQPYEAIASAKRTGSVGSTENHTMQAPPFQHAVTTDIGSDENSNEIMRRPSDEDPGKAQSMYSATTATTTTALDTPAQDLRVQEGLQSQLASANQTPTTATPMATYSERSDSSRMDYSQQISSPHLRENVTRAIQPQHSDIGTTDNASRSEPLDSRASSIYPEQSIPPSTRATSPSPRRSMAPSDANNTRSSARTPALPPLSMLEGLKVNKRGRILDEEGEQIGLLVEGDIIDCVRQKANAYGQVLDDYGRVVGRVSTIAGDPVTDSMPTTRTRHQWTDTRRESIAQSYAQSGYAPSASDFTTSAGPSYDRRYPYSEQTNLSQQRDVEHYRAQPARDVTGKSGTIELDASGYAVAAPLVDHSEIFMPPFLPPRSPKRTTSDDSSRTAHPFSPESFEQLRSQQEPQQQTTPAPALRKWASRNFEQDHDVKDAFEGFDQGHAQPARPYSQHSDLTRQVSPIEPPPRAVESQPQQQQQQQPTTEHPAENYPWMAAPSVPEEKSRWTSNMFSYKGDIPEEDSNRRMSQSSAPSTGAKPQQPAIATKLKPGSAQKPISRAPTKYHAAAGGTSAKQFGSRQSFREHVPHVKSPLSSHGESRLCCSIPHARDANTYE